MDKKSKKLLFVGGLVALLLALPLFLWAFLTQSQNYDIRERAQEPITISTDDLTSPKSFTFENMPEEASDTQTLEFRFKFESVGDGSAEGAGVMFGFEGDKDFETAYLPATHVGGGVYAVILKFAQALEGGEYSVVLTGEKHMASDAHVIQVGVPVEGSVKQSYDLTATALSSKGDIQVIRARMDKLCGELTAEDLKIADLDYSGCVDIKDVFLATK